MSRPQRLTREESRQQTQARLLAAAREVFGREGYAGTSVDAVAEAAGFSKGAFYSNFDSKEALFLALLERHMAGEVALSGEVAGAGDSVERVIERIAERYSGDAEDISWCLLSIEFALHATRAPAFAARRAALMQQHYESVAGIITAVARLAGAEVESPLAAAMAFVALRQGLALERRAGGTMLSAADVRAELERWMRSLVGLA